MAKVLIIATNVGEYENQNLKTGLWLSELTHLYNELKNKDYEVTIASPKGRVVPIDPESIKPLLLDKISKKYLEDADFMRELQFTKPLSELVSEEFDLVYLAGGHGTMYDFPNDEVIQEIVRNHYENNKKIGAICHGVCGLINVRLSNGNYLIKDRKITGFNWTEELLASRRKYVPFNLELELKNRQCLYKKSFIPMTSNVVVDGNLITGQNPFSSKEMAKVIIEELKK